MIAIVDYGAGNIRSVQNALNRLGAESMLTADAKQLNVADKVIFPGVGAAPYAMQQLRERGLDQVIPNLQQPVLGICLGLQLLCNESEEGNAAGLGVFDTVVKQFDGDFKIPHMGWNEVNGNTYPLFRNVDSQADFYYVHSYFAGTCEDTIATTTYGTRFSAALQKDNFMAVQFHPEKSGQVGERLLLNFLES